MGKITEVTIDACEKDEDQVKTQALDVWTSIAEEEYVLIENGQTNLGIIDRALDILIPLITTSIQDLNIGNEDVDEDQEWGTSVAAGCCLSLTSKVVGNKIVTPITQFVAENIEANQPWRNKYFGIIALGAILEGPEKGYLQNILDPAIPLLLILIDDPIPRIRSVACWLFSRLAKQHHELICKDEYFQKLFDEIMKGLTSQASSSNNICSIIAELAESVLSGHHKVHT